MFGVRNLFLFALLSTVGGWAQAGQLEVAAAPESPPSQLSDSIRQALAPEKWAVSQEGTTLAEIWFPREAPSGGPGGMALGVNFNQFPVGGLLGVIRLSAPWNDYKNFPIPAGLYVLRYGQQPADGNHTGITIYRDYAMLIPHDQDNPEGGGYSQPELNRLSRQTTGTPHPGIMALFPIWDPVEGTQVVPNEIDQPTLVWAVDGLQVGFVLRGHGELEGY